jgi:hypothetical protein
MMKNNRVQVVEIKRKAYRRQRISRDEESVLKYLGFIVWAVDRENSRNLKGYP